MQNTYAIILAAGLGSRLGELTAHYPKSLVKVNGAQILDYQLKGYLKAGVPEQNIRVVTGYKHEQIAAFLAQNYPLAQTIFSENFQNTNNMFSLYLALKELSNSNLARVLINNADCIYDAELMGGLICCAHENAIAVEFGAYNDESMKVAGSATRLTNIAKSLPRAESLGVSCDLYKFSRHAANALFEIAKDFIEVKNDLRQWSEVAFVPLFERVEVCAHDIGAARWVEVDNAADLAQADRIFSDFDLRGKRALICDMDGTLYVGETPIDSAIEFVKNAADLDFYFLTNNTSKTPADYAKKLNAFGIKASEAQILTPLRALVAHIKSRGFTSAYLLANDRVAEYLQNALPQVKFEFDAARNQAVILTYDTQLTYQKLANACELLCSGNGGAVEYIATHEDAFCPCEFGAAPDIGSFIALIKTAVQRVPSVVLGKPSPILVQEILAKYDKSELAVVGDRLYTDKKLADNIGCDFICVLTGETSRLDVQHCAGAYPSVVLRSLGFERERESKSPKPIRVAQTAPSGAVSATRFAPHLFAGQFFARQLFTRRFYPHRFLALQLFTPQTTPFAHSAPFYASATFAFTPANFAAHAAPLCATAPTAAKDCA